MININMNAILRKASNIMKQPHKTKQIEQYIDKCIISGMGADVLNHKVSLYGPKAAAEKFIEVLQNKIYAKSGSNASQGQLGSTAISGLINLKQKKISKAGKNKYTVDIVFADDLSRESLDSYSFPDGIYNIAALLDKGYQASAVVAGDWRHSRYKGDEYGGRDLSLVERAGAHFISEAIQEYMTVYASKYGVIDIVLSEEYE